MDLKDIKLYVDDRPEEGAFRVHRDLFADAELFELEQKYIFERTWGFLAFESQLAKPHDYIATHIGRAPVMVTRDASGELVGAVNMLVDITESKQAEEAIRASNDRFRIVTKATNDAVWDWDLSTNKVWWNEGVLTLFG